jgi:hypothetical protein
MIHATATIPVNPAGSPSLTRDQVWQGLVMKARDARQFLPPGACTKCEVVAEGDGYLVRDATILGADLREIVTFEPKSKVSFHQVSGPREGVIVNQILEDGHGSLSLRFYCLLGLRDFQQGGPEEQREQATMESGYRSALESTLVKVRELVAQGRI